MDTKISTLQFAIGGLIADRGDPIPVDYNIGFRNLSFIRWNGYQTIDFNFGDTNNQNIELEKTVKEIMHYIIDLCKTPMGTPYRERYDKNLRDINEFSDKIDFWYYRPSRNSK